MLFARSHFQNQSTKFVSKPKYISHRNLISNKFSKNKFNMPPKERITKVQFCDSSLTADPPSTTLPPHQRHHPTSVLHSLPAHKCLLLIYGKKLNPYIHSFWRDLHVRSVCVSIDEKKAIPIFLREASIDD